MTRFESCRPCMPTRSYIFGVPDDFLVEINAERKGIAVDIFIDPVDAGILLAVNGAKRRAFSQMSL